jgi:hypothetical protein
MNKKLDRIEAHLRTLFEKSLLKIITRNSPQRSLIDELMTVMRENLWEGPETQIYAPDQFMIHVPPEEFLEWQIHQDILDEMADSIFNTGQAEGVLFQKTPKIKPHANSEVSKFNFMISAHISSDNSNLPVTSAISQSEKNTANSAIPTDAFLIIGGTNNFHLNKTVIDIGRHSNNDLTLDDPHVSRHHAQLRAIKKHYVIFDVGSTAGIFLNGKKTSQATLQAGDVIRIGLINLIYIQETTSANPTTAVPIDPEVNQAKENTK